MNTLTIPAAILAAVAPFMAKKDVRYYLNGARIESERGYIRAIATDGHALAVCDAPGAETVAACILPREAVEWAVKAGGSVTLEWEGFAGTLTTEKGASMPVTLIDGRFPDYQAVIPMLQPDRTELAGFNPDILALVAKASAGLRKAGAAGKYCSVTLHGNGSNNAIGFELSGLNHGIKMIGVAMPLRDMQAPRSGFGLIRGREVATPGPECAEVGA